MGRKKFSIKDSIQYEVHELDQVCEFYGVGFTDLIEAIEDDDPRAVVAWGILYPESMNPNYKEILSAQLLSFAVSPLHDHDISADGNPKKAHYHIIIDFSDNKQKKSWKQFKEIFDSIGAVFSPVFKDCYIRNRRLAYRYLCHLDDANKARYDFNDIFSYGLAQPIQDIIFAEVDLMTCVVPVMKEFIVKNHLTYYCDFSLYCSANEPEWALACNKYKYEIIEFIKSFSHYCDKKGIEGRTVLLDDFFDSLA